MDKNAYKRQWRANEKAKRQAKDAELQAFWVPLPPDSKKCKKCSTLKPFTEFYKQTDKPNGMSSHCKVCKSINSKEKNKLNKESRKIRVLKYKADNKLKIKESARLYAAKKRKTDPLFRLKNTLRIRLIETLGYRKSKKSFEYFGCSPEQFRDHLEKQFKDGMTWENHGQYGWHVDHVIPISSFDLNDPEQVDKAFHYTNTQPLWWKDNLKKSNKVDYV